MAKYLGFLLVFIVVLNFSCKKNGCIDPLASNFDKKADIQNNSCTYLSDPYTGNWSGKDSCSSGNESIIEVVIEKHPTDKTKIILNYFSAFALEVEANFDGNTLTIPEQTSQTPFSSYSLQGNGQLNGNSLTINYSLNSSSLQEICQLILNKD